MRRAAALCVALAVSAPTPGANAASPCPFVTDARGDTRMGADWERTSPAAPSLDVVSGDLATSASRLAVTMRVAAYDVADPAIAAGAAYLFEFTVPGQKLVTEPLAVYAVAGRDGTVTGGWATGTWGDLTRGGPADVRYVASDHSFRAVVAFGSDPRLVRLGRRQSVLGNMHVTSVRLVASPPPTDGPPLQPFYGEAADEGSGTMAYRGGGRACISVPA